MINTDGSNKNLKTGGYVFLVCGIFLAMIPLCVYLGIIPALICLIVVLLYVKYNEPVRFWIKKKVIELLKIMSGAPQQSPGPLKKNEWAKRVKEKSNKMKEAGLQLPD